jgi:hypothetical protein
MFKATLMGRLLLFFSPLLVSAGATDSEQVLKLFSEAKTEASILQQDASDMNTFALSGVSWQSYAAQLAKVKTHVNKMAGLVEELNNLRIIGSPWQRIAIDRMNPLLKELATNTELTIVKLSDNPSRVHTPPYKEYVATHYELATDLASMIADFVEYGKTKAKFEALTRKLELPEP